MKIIDLAREAGFQDGIVDFIGLPVFERFANLVAFDALKDAPNYTMGYEDGAAAEREACAKVCDAEAERKEADGTGLWEARRCAAAIRARGQA